MKNKENKSLHLVEDVQMSEAQRKAICYKSDVLNQYFTTYDELVEAEEKVLAEKREKELAISEKKELAAEIEKSLKELNEAKKQAKEIIAEANKKAADLIAEKETNYYQLRNYFIKKYGSFHYTYTNDNGKETLTVSDIVNSFFDNLKLF